MTPIPLIDVSRLVNLVIDPATTTQRWADGAACADLPACTEAYFGDIPPLDALVRCRNCAVAAECLATALIHESQSGYREGWWGGTSPEAREGIASRLGIETTPLELDLLGPAALARHLRSQNRSIPSIAIELGLTERTVYRYLASTAA